MQFSPTFDHRPRRSSASSYLGIIRVIASRGTCLRTQISVKFWLFSIGPFIVHGFQNVDNELILTAVPTTFMVTRISSGG